VDGPASTEGDSRAAGKPPRKIGWERFVKNVPAGLVVLSTIANAVFAGLLWDLQKQTNEVQKSQTEIQRQAIEIQKQAEAVQLVLANLEGSRNIANFEIRRADVQSIYDNETRTYPCYAEALVTVANRGQHASALDWTRVQTFNGTKELFLPTSGPLDSADFMMDTTRPYRGLWWTYAPRFSQAIPPGEERTFLIAFDDGPLVNWYNVTRISFQVKPILGEPATTISVDKYSDKPIGWSYLSPAIMDPNACPHWESIQST
jgi:hypothetical protein